MKYVLLFLTLACVVAPMYALTCYSCGYVTDTAGTDEDCVDTFVPGSDQGNTTCDGICQKVRTRWAGVTTIMVRTCTTGGCVPGCLGFSGTDVCTNCCESDLCNSASSVQISIVSLMSAILVGYLVSRQK